MKRSRLPMLRSVALLLSGTALGALAQAPLPLAKPPVIPGERLSDWLLRNSTAGSDFTALHWRVNAERGPQEQLRSAVLQSLAPWPTMAQWVAGLPVTGRLALAHADARWLQGSPQDDPVLDNGHSLVLLARPTQVAVLDERGKMCLLPHRAGFFAKDYLRACAGEAQRQAHGDAADWVWMAQPDGRVASYGVAPWNAQAQDEPAPGAWLWAPSRSSAVTHASSGNLARFLATQLPPELLLQGQGLTLPDISQSADLPQSESPPMRDRELSASDWGEIGLLQTPTARMERPGAIRMNLTAVWPYTRLNVMLQPLDWLEMGFRYTDIANQLYGPEIAGGQSYKDKSLDLKLRLLQEDAVTPELALGLRDIGGTGLFSSEYLVANKRWGNWDASAGLGWGYMAGRGDISAPLAFLGESFKTRGAADVGQGGTISGNGMFRGNAAVFGGVQWHSPYKNLILKAELDGNDYSREPFGTILPASSPFNFGAVYRYSPYVDLSAAWERGNRLAFGLTLHAALDKFDAPKLLDPALPRVQVRPMAAIDASAAPQVWAALAQTLEKYTDWKVLEIEQEFNTLSLRAEADAAVFMQERVQRALVVLHNQAPLSVTHFVLQLQQRGVALSALDINRSEWVAQQTQAQAPTLRLNAQQLRPGTATVNATREAPVYQKPTDHSIQAEWGPSYSQSLGGPDGFVLYELGLQASLEQHYTPNTWLRANFNARLLDNYAGFKYDAPSNLPRVRTYVREFVTTSRVTMPILQLTHVQELGGGHYASLYGGMLEDMYAGVGGEWLYRPWQSKLAFGVDANRVRQRDFAQNFAMRDYTVNTGHATVYWDTGWNDVQVKASAGQYLAGDTGTTLDVKRVFRNGTAIGAWATKTNVSAEQFGEGSFDKGIYLSIPFDVMLPKSAPNTAALVWQPLTRDGGARLSRSVSLFDLTDQRSARNWSMSSKPNSGKNFVTGEDRSYVEQESSANLWQYATHSSAALGKGIAGIPGSTWAWGGAAILGASLLDNQVDQWAQNHQGGGWDHAGAIANSLPTALALGTGLLFTGLAGDDAAIAARSALTAAAYTVGANLLTKYSVGRARPADELGNSSFNGLTSTAAQSSFASNHVATAFALLTPFAQQYDKPWLYALAASSGLGRIQSREHWLSDVVAGGLLGYTIGTLTYEQQRGLKGNVRLSATTSSVSADWSF